MDARKIRFITLASAARTHAHWRSPIGPAPEDEEQDYWDWKETKKQDDSESLKFVASVFSSSEERKFLAQTITKTTEALVAGDGSWFPLLEQIASPSRHYPFSNSGSPYSNRLWDLGFGKPEDVVYYVFVDCHV